MLGRAFDAAFALTVCFAGVFFAGLFAEVFVVFWFLLAVLRFADCFDCFDCFAAMGMRSPRFQPRRL
jgi:hypothetical protein